MYVNIINLLTLNLTVIRHNSDTVPNKERQQSGAAHTIIHQDTR